MRFVVQQVETELQLASTIPHVYIVFEPGRRPGKKLGMWLSATAQ